MFSVIIPLYNKELSVSNTIQSVLDQTFQNFEIVIVNDGSTDNSVEMVEKFDDKRVRLIHQKNQGVSAARNKGINKAKNEWIAFLDADDLWMENHLEILKIMIEKYPKDKVFTTSYIQSNQNTLKKTKKNIYVIDNYFNEAQKNYITWTSIMCVNKEVHDKVGVFDVKLTTGEDLDLWARIGREYRYIKSNQITAIYRVDAENRSNLTFKLKKDWIYNYNFESSTSEEETYYYKRLLISTMLGYIKDRKIKLFWKLKLRYRKYISFLDIIRRNKSSKKL